MEQFKLIYIFATVLQYGSMNAAAPHLGMTASAISQAIRKLENHCGYLDLVGVARPFALFPDLANKMQNGTYQTVQTDRIQTGVALVDKKAGAMLEMNWYMTQMDLIGQGKQPNLKLSAWKVLLKTLWENGKAGLSTGRA